MFKKLKFDSFYKFRLNIISNKKLNKKILNHSNSFYIKNSNGFNRLYEDYKYKDCYLNSLKLLYQLKEGENYTFHPNTNKYLYSNYKNNSLHLNKKIKNINRIQKNFPIHSSYSNLNNIGNDDKLNDYIKNKNLYSNINQYKNQINKNNLQSKNSSYYNNLSLKPNDYFNLLQINENIFPIKTQKKLLNEENNNKYKNDNDINNKNTNINPINNSFQEINNDFKKIKNEDIQNLILKKGQSYIKTKEQNNILNLYKKFSNSLSKKDISNFRNFKLNKSIDSISKSRKKLQNKSNSNSINKNLSNASTEKYSFSYEQLTFKAGYNQTTHITLQSIPDEYLLKLSNNYLDTDKSLENFQKKNYLNNN
jgi:hypothetical protein